MWGLSADGPARRRARSNGLERAEDGREELGGGRLRELTAASFARVPWLPGGEHGDVHPI
jgi:hypothetical protein